MAEYHGGHKLYNATAHARCGSVVNCRAAQDTAALLGEQAAALASSMGFVDVDVQGASFAKPRELSLEWSPAAAARRLRLPSFTVSLVGRNLAMWTRYGGLDPEGIASPANAVLPLDNAVLPLPRQLLLRVDVGSRRLP